MSSTSPRVTFLLSVRNVARTIAETIESILAQTLTDFELLILDDLSTDGTGQIIGGFRDSRIRAVTNPKHLNHSEAANLGLQLARSEYVARIDGDDLCLPRRGAVQADYLDAHPDVDIVGGCIETFTDGAGPSRRQLVQYPLTPGDVSATMLLRNVLAQPAVMLRKSALLAKGIQYDPACLRAEDYDLWGTCVIRGVKMANIPEVLVRYRLHDKQGMHLHLEACNQTARATRKRLIEHLGLRPDADMLAIHEAIGLDQFVPETTFITSAARWLETLAGANQRTGLFDQTALMRLLTGRYVTLTRFAMKYHLQPPNVAASPFAPYLHEGVLQELARRAA
jgi:hypothetical protein